MTVVPSHRPPKRTLSFQLGAAYALAIHYGPFALADDAQADPPDRLRRALAGREDASCFWILPEGEGRQVPPLAADIVLNT